MRPSIGCLKHCCKSIINPSRYKLQDSYNTLPFDPKSLLYINSPNRINQAASSLLSLSERYPSLQIVSVTLDMKHLNGIGEIWFDKLIDIEAYNCSEKVSLFDDTEFSTWIHDSKISIELPMNFNKKSELSYSMFFKDPGNSKFTPQLSHLEISLPFDEQETKFSIKSQMKSLSPRLKLTDFEGCKIKSLNNKNAYNLFNSVKDKNESEGKRYRYGLEIASISKSDRCRVSMDPTDGTLIVHDVTIDENERSYVKILQVCLDEIKPPKVQNGLGLECYYPERLDKVAEDLELEIADSVLIGAKYGFSADGIQYSAPGDYVKVEIAK